MPEKLPSNKKQTIGGTAARVLQGAGRSLRSWFGEFTPMQRGIIIGGAAFLVCAVAALLLVMPPAQNETTAARANNVLAQQDATVAQKYPRLLDGVLVKKQKYAQAQPVGVMIENLLSVRPQAGLSAASVVYETYAEGGSTRFLAVYAGDTAQYVPKIGPVRSVRPYYLEWNSEYDGLVAYAGGSPDGLAMIDGFSIKDLNALRGSQQYFFRDTSLAAPHNLFTRGNLVQAALHDRKLAEASVTFPSWTFHDEPAADTLPAQGINASIAFSGRSYAVAWMYDRATNSYLRFNAGQPHLDANTSAQISAKNVIVEILSPIISIGEKGRLTLNVHGTGKAYLFTDGGVNIGTWSKADRTSRTTFTYADGSSAIFNRGATWVEVIPEDKGATYGTEITPAG